MTRDSRLRKQGQEFARHAFDSSEAALQSVGEYLGVRTPEPRSSSVEDALSFASGLLFGALVAAALAILLAPTDGQTLRRRLRQKWQELIGSISNVPERSYYSGEQTVPEAGLAADQEHESAMNDVMTLRGAQRATLSASPR